MTDIRYFGSDYCVSFSVEKLSQSKSIRRVAKAFKILSKFVVLSCKNDYKLSMGSISKLPKSILAIYSWLNCMQLLQAFECVEKFSLAPNNSRNETWRVSSFHSLCLVKVTRFPWKFYFIGIGKDDFLSADSHSSALLVRPSKEEEGRKDYFQILW